MQQNIRDGGGAHRIVRELAAIVEEVEMLGFDTIPLVDGTDDVADDCAQHDASVIHGVQEIYLGTMASYQEENQLYCANRIYET